MPGVRRFVLPRQGSVLLSDPFGDGPIMSNTTILRTCRESTIALGNFANGTADSKLPTAANMNELRWDCELESSAYKYAKSCSLTKSDPSTRPDVGEGVFIMVGNNTAKSMVVQSAWAKTTKIGCYMQNCPPSSSFVPFMDFLVCRYSKR
ncbi:unnamed protein product [Heligmosomoides polygyrus]|uniref:SCP domain-containing protein n=1 Tax=Heligmosomoides polygyrus TaxID=6339 RepID=A0A183FDA3_HELPZ|nr:unnamed protein product [Heligmosomoides polygyrus]